LRKDPQWPKEIDLIHISKTKQVDDICQELQKIANIPTVENLSANPGEYISVLAYIIKELEKEAAECTDQKKMPRLYSLFPNPNCKWKHIVLNVKALVSNTRQRQTDSYQQSPERFYRVFDFSKLGIIGNIESLPKKYSSFIC
jgi:hypothetical protein